MFYCDKSWNGKRYQFAHVKCFCYLIWKMFCHRANAIKPDCSLQTGWSISYKVKQFGLNLPHSNGKCFSDQMAFFSLVQMDIFYHFNFCHTRRNRFCCTVCSLIWAHYKAFSISIIIICVHSHPMIAPFFWENLTPYFYCSVVSQRLLQTFRFIISL